MSSSTSNLYEPSPSRREVKQTRRKLVSALCRKCREEEGTKKCSKCNAIYCSRECQKADWPVHKSLCALHTESSPHMEKFCQVLMANLLLRRYIEVLIILKLKLLQKPEAEKLFRVQIMIGFEPANIFDFFPIFDPSAVIDENPLQGMLQIYELVSDHADLGGFSETAAFPESELEKRRMFNHSVGLGSLPVGSIQFIHKGGEKITVAAMDMNIQEESMDLARQANELDIPVDFESGTTIKKPLSELTCIEHINSLIRQDTNNRWLLRMNMEKRHKQMINDAGVKFFADTISPDVFTAAVGFKVLRESIYVHQLNLFNASHRS